MAGLCRGSLRSGRWDRRTVTNRQAKRGFFHAIPVGKELEAFAKKWNKILYGKEKADGFNTKFSLLKKPMPGSIVVVEPYRTRFGRNPSIGS